MSTAQDPVSGAPVPTCEGSADGSVCGWLLDGEPKPNVDTALLERIFADPDLEHARERGGGTIEYLLGALFEWLRSFMGGAGALSFAEWTRTVILGAAVLLIVGFTVRWVRRRRAQASWAHLEELAPAPVEVLDLPSRHLARGREALAGAPREAIRQGLLALLSGLEEAGVIAPGRVRTNRELTQVLPASGAPPDEVERLTELLDWYDRAFYSLAPVTPEAAGDFLERVGTRLAALDRLEAAA